MRPFIGDTFSDEVFFDIITAAYKNFAERRGPLWSSLKITIFFGAFHGPTLALKIS